MLSLLPSSTPGQRIKKLREQLALTRELFEEKTGISRHTLAAWESDKLSLPHRTAQLLSQAFAALHVQVSSQYLLTGIGIPPLFPQEQTLFPASFDDEINIHQEINALEKSHPAYLIFKIMDETMVPLFNKEDIVAGYSTQQVQEFPLFKGRICLIETTTREKLLRKVLEVEGRTAQVSLLNPYTLSTFPILQKIKIRAIAPVSRHWHLNNRIELLRNSEDFP